MLSVNDKEAKAIKSKRLLLDITDLPCWPEDNTNNRPIPAYFGAGSLELDDEVINNNIQDNDMTNVRCMEAYTRVIEAVLLNKTKKELFPSISEVLSQWKIYGNALEIVEKSTHIASKSTRDNLEASLNAKGKDSEKNSRILSRREERGEKEEKEEQNKSSSGNIGLLVRADEVLDVHVKKNILITNKEGNDVVFKVVEVEVEESTLRSYTVGSSIESIMNRNAIHKK